MPKGNLARGFLPFTPSIADALSANLEEREQRALRERLTAMLTPEQVQPVAGD